MVEFEETIRSLEEDCGAMNQLCDCQGKKCGDCYIAFAMECVRQCSLMCNDQED